MLKALRGERAAALLPALIAAGCVLAGLAQLKLGRWQSDEYTLLVNERAWGWHILPARLAYSPRPFSEGLLHLYGAVVLWSGRPLIGAFLGLLWLGVIASVTAAAWWSLPRRPGRLPTALAVGLGLFAFGLIRGPETELFYWPMAAAAYLPTVGSAAALLFLLSDVSTSGRRLAAAAALLVAALSSEVGAALALVFAVAVPMTAVFRRRRRGLAAPGSSQGTLWWSVPGVAGFLVMLVIIRVRSGVTELGSASSPVTGHLVEAVLGALRLLPAELLASGTDRSGALLLLAIGVVALWRAAGGARVGPHHAALACALLGAAFFSIATALLHYGAVCCERHQATRFWFGDLLAILLVLAVWSRLEKRLAVPALPWIAAACLGAALLLPLRDRWPGLRADYAALNLAISGRDRTWASGRVPDGGEMAFYLPPDGPDMLVRGTWQPERRFAVDAAAPVMLRAMGEFFGKTAITVCQPYQTDNPWLMHGRRIEACPRALKPLIVVP